MTNSFFPLRIAGVIVALAMSAGISRAADDPSSLTIHHIDLKPTKDGFYDASVGLVMTDQKLGKEGQVSFSIVIAHVHDADEAMTKVHEPIKTLGADLQRGYFDLRREP